MKKMKFRTVEGKFRYELDSCSKLKDLDKAIILYDMALSEKVPLNLYHFNSLLYLCSCFDSSSSPSISSKELAISSGFRIFEDMISRNVNPNEATITAMARIAAAKGDGDLAFEFVKTMNKYNISPKLRTYDPVLFYFCENFVVERAFEVEEHMERMGVKAEEQEISALFRAGAMAGDGNRVYGYLQKLRSAVRCVSHRTAEIIEEGFSSEGSCDWGGDGFCVDNIRKACFRNGGGWHGLGWIGNGEWTIQRTNIGIHGKCCACSEQLVCVDIDKEETERFAECVASLAMEREVKEDFNNFKIWLEEHDNYEAVVDGANVGFHQQNFPDGGFSTAQLEAVVEDLYDRNQQKWPLIILHTKRLNMLMNDTFNKRNTERWKAADALYATPHGSNDDWYWLYAAVKLKCLVVTNDEMRDHIFELLAQSFFLTWKERHQVHYTFVKGDVKLQMPPPYSLVIQESENGRWHVPVTGDCKEESSREWLCIRRLGLSETFRLKPSQVNGKRKNRSPSPSTQPAG